VTEDADTGLPVVEGPPHDIVDESEALDLDADEESEDATWEPIDESEFDDDEVSADFDIDALEGDQFGGEEARPEEDRPPIGVDQPQAHEFEMGAALDSDIDAVAAAARTSLDMEGFETGAGFDLGDEPDEVFEDEGVDAMEVRSTAFEEIDQNEPEWSDSSETSGGDSSSAESGRSAEVRGDGPDSTGEGSERPPGSPTTVPTGKVAEPGQLSATELESRRKRKTMSRRLGTGLGGAVILGAAGFVVAYLGVVNIRGVTPADRVRLTVPAPIVLPGPLPESSVMSHVLYIDSWREAETPGAWASALHERAPELLGFVTPLLIEGDQRYALLVGPAHSVAEATALRDPLAVAFELLNPDPESWAVQESPYSFYFGEYQTIEEANSRLRDLAGLAIPAFVLQVTYPAGTGALRVYGGAFSDEVQAEGMGRLLNEHGLMDIPLTERRGRLPA
jgi:hypothetical protein